MFLLCLSLASANTYAWKFKITGRDGFMQRVVYDNVRKFLDGVCDLISDTVEDVVIDPIETVTGAHVTIAEGNDDEWFSYNSLDSKVYFGHQRIPEFRDYYRNNYESRMAIIRDMGAGDLKTFASVDLKLQEALRDEYSDEELVLDANSHKMLEDPTNAAQAIPVINKSLEEIVPKQKELVLFNDYLKSIGKEGVLKMTQGGNSMHGIYQEPGLENTYPEDLFAYAGMTYLVGKLTYKGVKVLAREFMMTGVVDTVVYFGRAGYRLGSDSLSRVSQVLYKLKINGKEFFNEMKQVSETGHAGLKEVKGVVNTIKNAADDIVSWIGKDARMIHNRHNDLVLLSKDGKRKFRVDIKSIQSNEIPHAHFQEFNGSKWKDAKSVVKTHRVYPQG